MLDRCGRSALLTLLAAGGLSCVGSIGDKTPEGGGGFKDLTPEAASLIGVSGLRRLTVDEYDNTLRDLLGDKTRPGALLLPDDVRTPYDNDYTNQVASQALIEGAEKLAGDAAERLMAEPARRDQVVGCTPKGPDDAACLKSFVTSFGRLALRRTLTQEEIDEYMTALDFAVEGNDFYVAIDTVIRAMLQDPKFLYRVEIGAPVPGYPGIEQLNGWELAQRLSYFLWGSTPDDKLLDLAETGQLDDADGVRLAATSMLEDPRARARIARFHALWIGYESLPYAPDLAEAMRAETNALIEKVVFDDKTAWQDIFRATETYVNDMLAEHYGLPLPGSTTPVWTSYGDSGRQGLLSHGSFLSIGAKFDDTSPTLRGLAVRTRLFCQTIPPPPPNVNVDDPIPASGQAVCKVDRYAAHRKGGCASCHELMDPVGFGLENYDQEGRYRTVEADHPECKIDGKGELKGIGTYQGPSGLSDMMLEAGLLNGCVVTQLYKFAVGRAELDDIDTEFTDKLTDKLGKGDFQFEDLLLEYVTSQTFAYRREEK